MSIGVGGPADGSEGPGTKVTTVSMVTDGLSVTIAGLLGGAATSSKRSQRVCQTRSEWSRREFRILVSALESRRDLMSSLRPGLRCFLDEGLVVVGEKGQQVSQYAEMAPFLVSGDGNKSAPKTMFLMVGPISRLRLTMVGCWQTERRWRRDSWWSGDGTGHRGHCGEMVPGG